MDQQRGRSPSNGHQQPHISHSNSASPHQFQDNGNAGLGLGLEDSLDQQYTSTSYTQNLAAYSNNFLGNQQGQVYVQGGLIDPVFTQSANFNQQGDFTQQFKQEELSPHNNASNSPYYQQQQSFSQQLLGDGGFDQEDFPLYSPPSGQDQFDPAAYMNHPQQAMAQSINPANLNMADMTTPPTHSPTPPHAQQNQLKPELSPHHSPAFNQHQFGRSPGHSRHTSLGPESAAFPQGGLMDPQWAMMNPAFSGHRRTPSEYSDRSVSSVAPSPNLPQHDNFDHSHSPLVRPTDQGHYPQELLPMEQFSLGGNQVHHGLPSPRRGLSPAHSPAISPRLGPQQMPMMDNTSNFMIGAGISNLGYLPSNAPPMYGGDGQDSFDNQNRHGSTEMGQAAQMVAPEINVEFAPPSRQSSFEPPKPMTLDQDALTPPHRGRARPRALSDPYKPMSAAIPPRSPMPGSGLSPESALEARAGSGARSLSPLDRSATGTPLHQRRRSTSNIPRDSILRLAGNAEHQSGEGGSIENGGPRRVQKHPATFQCTLCPKRFTRAYNLRSHLRTHTDERPFVCTVCGKAFARQHDRKRHEGLHSGEKKFVCKGDLKQGGQWGCGRRFARADALGRHFRSEAGRICIKPLLDEEAIERQRAWQEQNMQHMHNMQQQQPPPVMSLDQHGFPIDANGNYTLPAALLAQYPALATLSWADLPQGDAAMELDDEISGRSSFDASASDYYDEGDEAGYVSGPGTGYGHGQGGMGEGYEMGGYASDYGGA